MPSRTPWIVLLLTVVAAACSPAAAPDTTARLTVVTSTTVLADFVRAVVTPDVFVVSVVPYDTDPHVYEPKPADARLINDADVVFANGANLEPWFASLVVNATGRVVFVADAKPWPLLFEDDGRPDPHLWMVPTYAAGYVSVIADTLSDVDPAYAATYQSQAAAKQEVLRALHGELSEQFANLPATRRILVTSHDAFRYFGAAYGFRVASLYGVSTETQPSARDVQRLIDLLRREQIPTIFVETTVDQSVVERIARDANVRIGRPLYGDALGPPGSNASSYVAMMRHNAEAIIDGLNR